MELAHYYIAVLVQPPCFFECALKRRLQTSNFNSSRFEIIPKCSRPGYCSEILDLLSKTLRFNYTLIPSTDWNYLIDLVQSGKANFSANLLMVRESDLPKYNFLSPLNYYRVGYGVHVASRATAVESAHMFPPAAAFSATVWYLIFSAIIITALLQLYIFAPYKKLHAAMDILWYAFGLTLGGEIPETRTKKLNAMRRMALVLVITPSMFSFILLNYFYSEHIYSSLVAETQKLDFNSTGTLATVIESGKRQILYYSDRKTIYETIMDDPPLPSYRKLKDALQKNPPLRIHTKDMPTMFRSHTSYVWAGTGMSFYTNLADSNCATEFVEDKELLAFAESIVVNKNFSRYREFYEASVEVLPLVNSMLKKYYNNYDSICAAATRNVVVGQLPTISLANLKPLLYMLAAGSVVGLCYLLAETLWHFKCKKQHLSIVVGCFVYIIVHC